MSELQHKIYQSEEENCTFTPKINNTKIRYSIPFYDENNKAPSPFNKGNNSKTISNNFNSNINVNINKYNNNNFILNETKSIKLLRKLSNTNSFFYPGTVKNQQTDNENKHNRRNSFRTLKLLNNYHTSKDSISLNYNKLIDKFIIDELNEMNLFNQNQKYNEINKDNNLEKQNGIKMTNKTKRNKFKNIIMKRNLSNKDKNINRININNFNKINNIEIEDNNKENVLLRLNNFVELYNKKRNKTVTKNNQQEIKKSSSLNEKDNKYKNIKTTNCNKNKILKKTKSTVLNKKNNIDQLNKIIDQEEMDYFKYRMNINSKKNNLRKGSNDSKSKAEKDLECKPKKKRVNSLQKYNSSLYEFIEPNPEENNKFNRIKINDAKRLKEINDIFKDIPLSKRNKSYSSIYANRNISNSYINNFTTNHKNILNGNQTYSIKEINDNLNNYVNNNSQKRSIPKIEYFYTFRNKKIQYNSFNCFSNFNPKTNKNINNKIKSSNESNNNMNNNKNSNTKNSNSKSNNIGIAILDNSKRKTNIRNIYHLNNKINSIYSNNYDKKNNYIINKINHILNDNNKSKNNSKSNNNSYAKIIRPSINTNNTNNDTKGYSSSTLSAKDIKTNSKRESKNNISIQNKNENISKNIDSNSNKNNNNNKNIIINNNKPNIRKYINDYNNKSDKENINKFNKLNYNINKDFEGLKIKSKVSEEYFKNQKKQRNNDSTNKNERSMTLQSLSDSKMLELAEHYINNYKDDVLNDIGIKKIVFKKSKANQNKNITFSEELK